MRIALAFLIARQRSCSGIHPAQPPAFEVATVKVNHSGDGSTGFPGLRNGIVTARNASLRMLLRAAYNLSETRIIGPAWLDADRFDIEGSSRRRAYRTVT